MTFLVRRATHADAYGILQCLATAFEPYRHDYTPAGFADTVLSPETIATRLSVMTLFVAQSDTGEIIGTIGCNDNGQGEGHLRGMAVLPSLQGRGVAAALLSAAEQALKENGCQRITLDTTRPLHRAIRFYESNGYVPTGVVGDFFGMELIEYAKTIAQ